MTDTDTSAGNLRLPDRPAALAALERLLLESWRGFDQAREGQPPLSEDLRERLGRPLPGQGMDAVEGLEIAGAVLDASIAQPRPRFLAYVGSSGLEIGVLGDALMACHDVNVAVSSGGADLLEREVVAWVGEFVGFGDGRRGVTTSGGTIANLTALTAAPSAPRPGSARRAWRTAASRCTAPRRRTTRSSARRRSWDSAATPCARSPPVCTGPWIRWPAPRRSMRTSPPASRRWRSSPPRDDAHRRGRSALGARRPVRQRDLWLHVDGAYGLPAAGTAEAAPLFAGLDRADSATVDAHKWLFVPKACSVLLVRDRGARAAFAHDEAYIPHVEEESRTPSTRPSSTRGPCAR